jgi:glycosyltransferase involved in cell wall biosynthesis
LIVAFACGPAKGSEPGVGWAWTEAASKVADVELLTTPLYRADIDEAVAALGSFAPRVHYVTRPDVRLADAIHVLGYRAWKRAAESKAEELHAQESFDLVHHLSYGNIWLEPVGGRLRVPFVVGPLNGGPRVALRLYPALGLRGAVREAGRQAFRVLQILNPRARRYWSNATAALVMNQETLRRLPLSLQSRSHIEVRTATPLLSRRLEHVAQNAACDVSPFTVLAAGRLLPWKGFALAVHTLTHLPEWRLTIVGTGPDAERIERLANRLGVTERTTIAGWLPHAELWELMSSSQVVLVPSLRDDGPSIVIEALALGRPVVALDQGIAAYLGERPGVQAVEVGTVGRTARRLAEAVRSARPPSDAVLSGLLSSELSVVLAGVYRDALAPPTGNDRDRRS